MHAIDTHCAQRVWRAPMRIWREREGERESAVPLPAAPPTNRESGRGVHLVASGLCDSFSLPSSLPPSPAHSSTLRPPCPSFPRQSSPNSEGGGRLRWLHRPAATEHRHQVVARLYATRRVSLLALAPSVRLGCILACTMHPRAPSAAPRFPSARGAGVVLAR